MIKSEPRTPPEPRNSQVTGHNALSPWCWAPEGMTATFGRHPLGEALSCVRRNEAPHNTGAVHLFGECGIPFRRPVQGCRVSGDPHWLKSAPRRRDVTHQQGAVEDRTAWREPVRVIKEAGTNGMDLDRLDAPAVRAQFHAVEPPRITGGGESRRVALEEVGCLPQVSEQPAPLKPLRCPDVDANAGRAISTGESHVEIVRCLVDVEQRPVVLTGE